MNLVWSETIGYGLEKFYKIFPLYGSVNVTNFVHLAISYLINDIS